jgi:hypothetical protein
MAFKSASYPLDPDNGAFKFILVLHGIMIWEMIILEQVS